MKLGCVDSPSLWKFKKC